ncbi:MazG nucleotide pyrophosphohydrolase domain-containing protein [Curtobacterium ammoniigenes]|uniref:MazG nucleotide pyrophosphohydrolase domain-containing protein n=1 Tax=Curtobacterium ammoniigenes TaxID=395387 RepID=UPI00082E0DCE|nr:MazG nucleotide pyrophosphohydrolase domain-containing protein [Curtobacterium ammoniigenes]
MPASEEARRSGSALESLVRVIDRLLDPVGGCVWNRAQTHRSLARYVVEEAYELVDAIDDDDHDGMQEELADILYQVVLHAGIAERAGEFALTDVIETAREKMTRRHPHVFGSEVATTEAEVVRVWLAAKQAEKAHRTSPFDGVPRAMAPLERAVALAERAPDAAAAIDGARTLVSSDVEVDRVPASARTVDRATAADRLGDDAATGGTAKRVDPAWGLALMASVVEAGTDGIDAVGSVRAALAAFEQAASAGSRRAG